MPKVSVIIPVYGVEKYIERCARSLFEQTLDDIEYLFIDDCTLDKSIEVLKSVLEEYPNRKDQVIIHRMEQNSGQAAVRKWGMQNATGSFIIHCDSDDWVDKKMYESMYKKAVQENADLVLCDYYNIYLSGETEYVHRVEPSDNAIERLRKMLSGYSGYNLLWCALIKYELLNGLIYPTGNQGEDGVIMRQVFWKSTRISLIHSPLYYYNIQNPTSISNIYNSNHLIRKSQQITANCLTTQCFLNSINLGDQFEEEMVFLKFSSRLVLWNGRKDPVCISKWGSIFPEINKRIFFNKYINLKYKLIHILIVSRMYYLLKYLF